MTPKEINEFIGREVMGWTLRKSKNPQYNWWIDNAGFHRGMARNWIPSQHYFGLCDCFHIIEKLIINGFGGFTLEQISCVGGFTWAASIKGWAYPQSGVGVKECFRGAGNTPEEAICSMAVNTVKGVLNV